jgi:hypothetical protein
MSSKGFNQGQHIQQTNQSFMRGAGGNGPGTNVVQSQSSQIKKTMGGGLSSNK